MASTKIEPMAIPFLKWIGGKKNFVPTLAPTIKAYLEETGGDYYEPFMGGGAMALALGLPDMQLNDVIEDLVKTYRAVRDNPIDVVLLLSELRDWGTEESNYYSVRATEPGKDIEVAARMIYLNMHCFNGLWRTNKKGQMNAAYGKQSGKLTDSLFERIGEASKALKHADIYEGDFEPVVKQAGEGDLVYVDPPYDGTYAGYSEGGFCGVSQDRLASELCEAHKKGVAFICHNSDTEKVRSWYSFATLLPSGESRAVNADGGGRGKAKCLLITNKPSLLLNQLTS